MAGEPFADGDDPDDAYDASDPIAECLTVIVRRIGYVRARSTGDLADRLDAVRSDVGLLVSRLRAAAAVLRGD